MLDTIPCRELPNLCSFLPLLDEHRGNGQAAVDPADSAWETAGSPCDPADSPCESAAHRVIQTDSPRESAAHRVIQRLTAGVERLTV